MKFQSGFSKVPSSEGNAPLVFTVKKEVSSVYSAER